jgi:ADP-heptose:LPS heptosyltransferase
VWNYRVALGDVLQLDIPRGKKRKIVLVPVFDAPYNVTRNWSVERTQQIIDRFSGFSFEDYEKVVCSLGMPSEVDMKDFKLSTDFNTNVEHILTSEIFVGGDTGLTHFAGVLKNGPKCIYYIPKDSARNTYPMNFEQGELNLY